MSTESHSRDRNGRNQDRSRRDYVKTERSDSYPRKSRSRSPRRQGHRVTHRERSPTRRGAKDSHSRDDFVKKEAEEAKDTKEVTTDEPEREPIKPNYSHSGLLSAESKKDSRGNVLKYHEPVDSVMPPNSPEYRIYVFSESKEGELIDTIKLNQKSHYLLGRDQEVCDIPVDIRSCSRQHAVIQFRRISKTDKYGDTHHNIKPYIIDLDSSYGTQLNHDDIPPGRYVELRNKDLIQFCGHDREYVLMES